MMPWALLAPVFVASLMGSVHCAGMCGGFVSLAAGSDRGAGLWRAAGVAGAYHGARLGAYLALGGAAGALGSALDLGGAALGVGRLAMVVAGAVVAATGLVLLLQAVGVPLPAPGPLSAPRRLAARLLAGLGERPPLLRAGVLGAVSGLLPCGWLWAFVITAAGTGSALWGMAIMVAFWAGTVPLLAGLGSGAHLVARRLGRHAPLVTALLLLGVGVAGVLGRVHVPVVAAQGLTAPGGVPDGTAPCCHGGGHP